MHWKSARTAAIACCAVVGALIAGGCSSSSKPAANSAATTTTVAASVTTSGSTASTASAPTSAAPASSDATTLTSETASSSEATTTSAPATASLTGIDSAAVDYVKPDTLTGSATGVSRGVTADSIKMGCVYDPVYPSGEIGLQSYFKTHTDKILGRSVDLEACVKLSPTDPAGALTAVQKIVEQDKVFGIFMFCSGAECGQPITNYLVQNEVPTWGIGSLTMVCGVRLGFGNFGCSLPDTITPPVSKLTYGWAIYGAVKAAIADLKLDKNSAKIGAVGTGVSATSMNVANATVDLAKADYTVDGAAVGLPATAASDFSPIARTIVSDGVNVLAMTPGLSTEPAFIAALKAAGYKGATVDAGSAYIPGLAQTQPDVSAALDGNYSDLFNVVPYEQHTAWTQAVVAGLSAVGKGPVDGGYTGLQAFVSAEMFEQMVTAAGQSLDTKTLDAAVNGGSYAYKSAYDGGPPTIPFPAGHFTSANCHATVQNVKGEYKVIAPLTCEAIETKS